MTAVSLTPQLAGFTVRPVDGLHEFQAVEHLYTTVMHLRPGDGSINPRLLIALQHNSGLVLGAYDTDGAMVGFTYSFLAREPDGTHYQYSQTAAVLESMQGRGVGRALKLAQRDEALARNVRRIRLAYDPLRSRNAHFNLDVLGAVADRFEPDMYGEQGFGADAHDRTDRLVVRWDLERPPSSQPGAPTPELTWQPGVAVTTGSEIWLPVPADWATWRADAGPQDAARVRSAVGRVLADAVGRGLVAVSCRRVSEELSVYRLTPEVPG